MFGIGEGEEKGHLDKFFKEKMILEIGTKIQSDNVYRDNLISFSGTYMNTLNYIIDAVPVYEIREEYEMCATLIYIKKEILKKVNQRLV